MTILKTLTVALALTLNSAYITAQAPAAAAGGVQRTVVQRGDVSVPGREAVTVRIEIAPNAATGRHTHPGDEVDYVLEGQLEVTLDGQAPKLLNAGESIIIPAGTVHNARAASPQPVKAVGVYIVEKGKTITVPAP
jgi:quercetin dioxygenase-like cupin family protein